MYSLWLISQDQNNGYDTYDAAVVCAATENAARNMHPGRHIGWTGIRPGSGTWADSPDNVTVKWIGVADPNLEPGVILASFNAG